MTNVVEGAGAPLARLGARYRPRQAGGGRPRQARQVRPTMPAARPARQTERHNTSDFQTAPPLHPSTFQCGADLNLSSRDFRPKTSEQASSGSQLEKKHMEHPNSITVCVCYLNSISEEKHLGPYSSAMEYSNR